MAVNSVDFSKQIYNHGGGNWKTTPVVLGQTGTIDLTLPAGDSPAQHFVAGIPIPKSHIFNTVKCFLTDSMGNEIASSIEDIVRWRDGSIKIMWVGVTFTPNPLSTTALTLNYGEQDQQLYNSIIVTENANDFTIDTSTSQFVIDTNSFNAIQCKIGANTIFSGGDIVATNAHDGLDYQLSLDSGYTVTKEFESFQKVRFKIEGQLMNGSSVVAKMRMRAEFYYACDYFESQLHIYDDVTEADTGVDVDNRDLPLSLSDYRIKLNHSMTNFGLSTEANANVNGVISTDHYISQVGDWGWENKNGDSEPDVEWTQNFTGESSGNRCDGWASVSDGSNFGYAMCQRFWQEYPGEISVNSSTLDLVFHSTRGLTPSTRTPTQGNPLNITSITSGNPCTITTDVPHNYTNGKTVSFAETGLSSLDDLYFVASNVTSNTLEVSADGTGWVSGGKSRDTKYLRPNTLYFLYHGGGKTYKIRVGVGSGAVDYAKIATHKNSFDEIKINLECTSQWYVDSGCWNYLKVESSDTSQFYDQLQVKIFTPAENRSPGSLIETYGWRDGGDFIRLGNEGRVNGVGIPSFYNDQHFGATKFIEKYLQTKNHSWLKYGYLRAKWFSDICVVRSARNGAKWRDRFDGSGGDVLIETPPGETHTLNHSNVDHESSLSFETHASFGGMPELWWLFADWSAIDTINIIEGWYRSQNVIFFNKDRRRIQQNTGDGIAQSADRSHGLVMNVLMEIYRCKNDAAFLHETMNYAIDYMIKWWKHEENANGAFYQANHVVHGEFINDQRTGDSLFDYTLGNSWWPMHGQQENSSGTSWGTQESGSGFTVIDSTKNFAPDYLVGCSIQNQTTGSTGSVTANTATTITTTITFSEDDFYKVSGLNSDNKPHSNGTNAWQLYYSMITIMLFVDIDTENGNASGMNLPEIKEMIYQVVRYVYQFAYNDVSDGVYYSEGIDSGGFFGLEWVIFPLAKAYKMWNEENQAGTLMNPISYYDNMSDIRALIERKYIEYRTIIIGQQSYGFFGYEDFAVNYFQDLMKEITLLP